MLKRTLSKKNIKNDSDNLSYFIAPDGKTLETRGPASSDATTAGKRVIKARVKVVIHGVQNVPSGSGSEEVAVLSWKRGTKKANSGKTSGEPVIFGMSTWKKVLELEEVSFFQDKASKDVAEKTISFRLKVGPKSSSKKHVVVGSKTLDLAEFYKDGTKVDKMVPLTQGSNPVTLKLSIETRWTHIDNKLIVRGKSPRKNTSSSSSSSATDDESYDLKTVTFDSEDEISVAGEKEFSEDEEDDAGKTNGSGGFASADQAREIAALRREIEELKGLSDQLREEVKRGEEKIETYRSTVKTKNDQIADLKTARDEKAALLAGAQARLTAGEERAGGLQTKLEAVSAMLKEREDKNEQDRQRFERELRELRSRNEELHAKLTAETASNASFLVVMEKQTAENAAALQQEVAARQALEQELAQVTRREQSLVAELEEVIPEQTAAAVVPPGATSSVVAKDVSGAVIDVIRNRRKAAGNSPAASPSKARPAAASTDAELAALKEQNRALAAEVKVIKAECEQYKAEIGTNKDHLSSLKSAHESDMARLLNERDAARRRLQEAESKVRELEKRVSESKDLAESLQKRNEQLAQNVRESLEARALANAALVETREAHSKMAAEISAKQRDLIRTSNTQAAKLEELRAQAAQQLQDMEMAHVNQTESLRAEVKRLEAQLAQVEKEQKDKAAITTPRGTVADAALSLGKEVAGGEAAALRQHFTREKLELERIAERAKDETRRAEEELARMERRVTNAEKALNEARRQADEAKSAAADAVGQVASLKEQNEDRERVLMSAEKEFVALSRQAAELTSKLVEREQNIEQLQLRVAAATKQAEAAHQQLEAVEKRAALAEQSLQERESAHKAEVTAVRDKLTEARSDLRRMVDKCKAAEIDRDANARRISLLQSELATRTKAEASLSDELAATETKLRSCQRSLALCEEQEKQKSASLEVEVDAKTTSLQELSQRLVSVEAQMVAERAKSELLHAQLTHHAAVDAVQLRELQVLREELEGAKDHVAAAEDMLERKNKNIATLEAEVQSVEAELAKVESQVALFKRQAADRNVEAQSQKESAEVSAALATQLQDKLDKAVAEGVALRAAHAKAVADLEQAANEAKRQAKEMSQSVRLLEQERDQLRGRLNEAESLLRSERTRAESVVAIADRVPELEEELAAAQEANRAAEKRIKQLRESSGELGEKVEQLVALEKERQERKLVISCVLLGATDDDQNAKEQVARSAKGVVDSLAEWGSLTHDHANDTALTKVGNGYQLLLQSSIHSYYHCIRVLAQLCSLAKQLRARDVNINDPARTGVACTADRSSGHPGSACDEFVAKIELVTEKAFIAVGEAIFRRVSPYLAPAILNHMPAQHEHQIEETVVDSGSERGKFMSHTVLSTLTDARDWMLRLGLPEAVMKQLFVTLTYNLNAYLFQYLIQTPSICFPTNAFTIKTRLGLLSDWFSQERNAAFQEAYKQLRPMDEASVLLFVDRNSFSDWATVCALCPSLNPLQVMSLVEMMSEDETQRQPLPKAVRDGIDKIVIAQDDMTLFFRPKTILPLEQ